MVPAQDQGAVEVDESSLRPSNGIYLHLAGAKALRRGDIVEMGNSTDGAWTVRAVVLRHIPPRLPAPMDSTVGRPCTTAAGQMDYTLLPVPTHMPEVSCLCHL